MRRNGLIHLETSMRHKYILLGPCPSKKSRHRAGKTKTGKLYIYKDPAYSKWELMATNEFFIQRAELGEPPISGEINLACIIHRADRRKADLTNMEDSIQDALQGAGVIDNDAQVVSQDGSRLYRGVGVANERIEIIISDPVKEED